MNTAFPAGKGCGCHYVPYDALARALRAANEKGIKVPEVHIVGFGDEFNDESLAALLTTFRVPKTRMGGRYQRSWKDCDPTEPVRVVMPTSFAEALQLQGKDRREIRKSRCLLGYKQKGTDEISPFRWIKDFKCLFRRSSLTSQHRGIPENDRYAPKRPFGNRRKGISA